jgi:hypothetical protein
MRLRRTRTGMNRRLFLGGRSPPKPSRGRGVGKPGFPLPLRESQARPRAGAWENPVSLYPRLRAAPSQTLPRAGVWGSPAVIAGVGLARPARGAGAWGNPVSLYPLRESQARPRAGRGETRFPYTPA